MLRPWHLTIHIDKEAKSIPLYEALAQEIRRLIESGSLHNGDALPGSRELAAQLCISRRTVVTAMEKLTYAGLLERRERVGLFVRYGQEETCEGKLKDVEDEPKQGEPTISPSWEMMPEMEVSDSSLMPSMELSRAYRLFFNRAAKCHQMDFVDPRGVLGFRQAIAMAMCHSRGMCVCPTEVLITRGDQQALYLTAHALLSHGDVVAMEQMAHPNAVKTFESAGVRVVHIPVDADGMQVDRLKEVIEAEPRLKAVYATPRLNYPTTVHLSAERCQTLAELAVANRLLVVEDDFDGMTHLTGSQTLPLAAYLPKENSVYVCTATRILAQVVRVGFVMASKENIEKMTAYRTLVDVQGDPIMERALLELIEQGEIRRHMRRITKIYGERLDYISRRIKQELKGKVAYRKPTGGLAIWLEMLQDPTATLQSKGIAVPVYTLDSGRYGLRIAFASMPKEKVDALIAALAEV